MLLSDAERRIVRALGYAMFPRDRSFDADALDAEMDAYVDDYAARMPPWQQLQLRALFQAFERGYGLYMVRPTARFTTATPAQQREFLEFWDRSVPYALHMVWEGLRMVLTIAYFESDAVRRLTGLEHGYELALRKRAERAALAAAETTA